MHSRAGIAKEGKRANVGVVGQSSASSGPAANSTVPCVASGDHVGTGPEAFVATYKLYTLMRSIM